MTHYVLKSDYKHYFEKISVSNTVVITDHALRAQVFDNQYSANAFQTLLKKTYNSEFTVYPIF